MKPEYFHECFCGDILAVGGVPANSEDCNTPCVGDPTEPCGGPNRLNLFWSGETPPAVSPGTNGWSSIGCYSEGTTGRTLQYQYLPPDGTEMTVDICTSACRDNAYTFAGLEYADGKISSHSFLQFFPVRTKNLEAVFGHFWL